MPNAKRYKSTLVSVNPTRGLPNMSNTLLGTPILGVTAACLLTLVEEWFIGLNLPSFAMYAFPISVFAKRFWMFSLNAMVSPHLLFYLFSL